MKIVVTLELPEELKQLLQKLSEDVEIKLTTAKPKQKEE